MENRVYTITEYGTFLKEIQAPNSQPLPAETFDLLRQFVLSPQNTDVMGLTVRGSLGEAITARNYAGVIALPNGDIIQILPKICSAIPDQGLKKAKKLLVDMLCTLKNSPFHRLPTARVDVARTDILDIFIRMFLDEVNRLSKRGFKSGYESVEENIGLFKGKLLFAQQLRCNYAHRERCYATYDQFTPDRAENRLIKRTLLLLRRKSGDEDNRRDISRILYDLEAVAPSQNVERDFAQCSLDRGMQYYCRALEWCRVFLRGQSFSSFSGDENAIALLYPMEKLFEAYVAAHLSRSLDSAQYEATVQGPRKYLCEVGAHFAMRPDISVLRKSDKARFIFDTKWKLLDAGKDGLNINRADLYQMYAYQMKYKSENVTLIYPQTAWAEPGQRFEFCGTDHFHVTVCFIDLFCMQESIKKLQEQFETTEKKELH